MARKRRQRKPQNRFIFIRLAQCTCFMFSSLLVQWNSTLKYAQQKVASRLLDSHTTYSHQEDKWIRVNWRRRRRRIFKGDPIRYRPRLISSFLMTLSFPVSQTTMVFSCFFFIHSQIHRISMDLHAALILNSQLPSSSHTASPSLSRSPRSADVSCIFPACLPACCYSATSSDTEDLLFWTWKTQTKLWEK